MCIISITCKTSPVLSQSQHHTFKLHSILGGRSLNLQVSPKELTTAAGSTATFVCSAQVHGTGQKLILRWTWSDGQLDSDRVIQSVQSSTSSGGQTTFKTNTLQILDLTSADAGTYTCQASYENQHKQLTVWLHINDKGSQLWWISIPAICVPLLIGAVILCFCKRRNSKNTADNTNRADLQEEGGVVNPDTDVEDSSLHQETVDGEVNTDCVAEMDVQNANSSDDDRVYSISAEEEKRGISGSSQPNHGCPQPQHKSQHSTSQVVTMRSTPVFELSENSSISRKQNPLRNRQRDSGYASRDALDAVQEDFKWGSRELKQLKTEAREKLCKMSPSERLQTNIVSKSFASGVFNENGGHLSIPEADVHMFIPPQAIKTGRSQEVYIYLERNPSCNDKVMLGPVLHCGPPGLKFDAQVIFSLPINTSKWKLVPMRTETDIEKPTNWTPISETADALCFIEGSTCTFLVDHFTGHGMSCNDDQAFLIGAFTSLSRGSLQYLGSSNESTYVSSPTDETEYTKDHFMFHIRCWKNDQKVTKNVLSMEEEQRCRLLDKSLIHMHPDVNKKGLELDIEEVSPGWTQVTPRGRTVVPYDSLMTGSEDVVEVAEYDFKLNDNTDQRFKCQVIAYQLDHQEDQAKLDISCPDSPEVLREQKRDEQLLPPEVFNNICKYMDIENYQRIQGPNAKGWKSLAKQLGLPTTIIEHMLTKTESTEERRAGATPLGAEAAETTRQIRGPTATILGLWELQNKRQGLQAIQTLRDTFHRLGRPDVCRILDPVIEGQQQHFEEHPGVETSRYLIRYHTQLSPVQEASSGLAGTSEETTVPNGYVNSEAVQFPSNELYETDRTSGIGSSGSSTYSDRSRQSSSGSLSQRSTGSTQTQ
ncbi:netrin receptor UNC5C-like [Branchiostoma floridae]|uniref:Netrin receptor UNC5 n=1 Tax=Branchiostoma floridae TaxID=7739 RepID=A0A9J7MYP4_BRAFL|nr:netrin receptor UNC5C-like [Branchiostoma floridae]